MKPSEPSTDAPMPGIHEVRFHPEVVAHDLPWVQEHLGPDRLQVFRQNLAAVVGELRSHPLQVGTECRHELAGWRRHKFFIGRVRRGYKPMGRVVYRVDEERGVVFVEVVWFKVKEPHEAEPDLLDLLPAMRAAAQAYGLAVRRARRRERAG